MSHGLLIGGDKQIADWAYSTFNRFPMPVDRALGIVGPEGELKGAILFNNFNGINVELSYYGPNTLSAGIVRSIARVIITDFRPARLTVVTSKRNKRLISALCRLGFGIEGSQRRFYGTVDNKRNTAVRLVIFYEKICKVAGVKPSSFH